MTDALNGINQQENQYAETLRQSELDREEQAREAAASRAASASSLASPSFGATSSQNSTDPLQQLAYNDVYTRLSKMTPAQIQSDYLATLRSANYGNLKDKYKIQIYNQFGYHYGLPAQQPGLKVNNAPNTQSIRI